MARLPSRDELDAAVAKVIIAYRDTGIAVDRISILLNRLTVEQLQDVPWRYSDTEAALLKAAWTDLQTYRRAFRGTAIPDGLDVMRYCQFFTGID